MNKKSAIAKIEYGVLLNWLANINPRIALYLVSIRGWLNGKLRRDFWRIDNLNDTGLIERMVAGVDIATRGADTKSIVEGVFQTISREELESAWLANSKLPSWRVEYDNHEAVERHTRAGKRVIFLTSHYGSNILGIGLLGRMGYDLLTMSSDFFMKNPTIPDTMKDFYTKKYTGLAGYLNRGDVIPQEGNLKRFYRFLRDSGHVVILGDLPTTVENNPVWVDFFGAKRAFAPGAVRMAEAQGVCIVSFVCKPTCDGYKIFFSDIFDASMGDEWYQGAYSFLEKHIVQNPELYYGIDLLPLFAVEEVDSRLSGSDRDA